MAKHLARQRIQLRLDDTVLAIGRQAEEGEVDVAGRHAGRGEQGAATALQHGGGAVHADFKIIGAAFRVARQHLPLAVDQRERGLGAAAINPEKHARPPPADRWSRRAPRG